ncbi:MAG: hypothetical protein K2Y23_24350 [Cyanobacteria bacterium]|nr:hypothetical protein [Cyanobacteriota bacterium]
MRAIFMTVFVAAAAILSAQAPDFSGTWRLDESKSRVTATAGITGLIPAGAPKTLHITHSANGTIVIESQINEAHARIYRPGKETATPAGQGGAVTTTSKWEGTSLVIEGALKAANGATTAIREVLSLGAGGTLTMEVTTTAGEKASSTLVYTKITDVGPCNTWPTPCKRPK